MEPTYLEYQITPLDYFVKEYFLAKSLIYVLPYIDDDILFEVALHEAIKKYRAKERDIRKHITEIKHRRKRDVVSESGAKLL